MDAGLRQLCFSRGTSSSLVRIGPTSGEGEGAGIGDYVPEGALKDLRIRIGAENQGQEIRHPLRGALIPRDQVVRPRSIHGEKF